MSFAARLIRSALPLVPRRLVWIVARRYVAGPELGDALVRIREATARGFGTILDILGEHSSTAKEAEQAAAEYRQATLGLQSADPHCAVSVKPTHLGLLVDEELCARLLGDLCQTAARDGRTVRLEMEDAPTIDATLEVFEETRVRHRNLGCVLQSRLFRSRADAERLLASGPELDVRLVKGIYPEPARIAWTQDDDISRNFVDLAALLLDGGAHVALATHDDAVADACLRLVQDLGLQVGEPTAAGRYEFQCLLGVRPAFADRLRAAGHAVRIYVPYGRDWHAYSMRRMNRNPQIARAVFRAALRLDR